MKTKSDNLMPIAEAYSILIRSIEMKVQKTEKLPINTAIGKVLAADITATVDVPAYDNSAMDGYAFCISDIDSGQIEFEVQQVIAAGHPGSALQKGKAVRIFTGAPLPEGADCVVIQENTEAGEGYVKVLEKPVVGENIRLKGHDIKKGTIVLSAGHRLRAQEMGLLSSLGIKDVCVFTPLTVALINTGDEVIPPGKPLGPGQLYDSNSYTLEGLLQSLGLRTIKMGIVEDDLDTTCSILSSAAQQADCIISTGGVSVGDEDHVKAAVEKLGDIHLWKLAIKPGKPFSYGTIADKPLFALPGNPVAVFITFVMLVRPCLLKLQGAMNINAQSYLLPAGFDSAVSGSRQEYVRVRVNTDQQGNNLLATFPDQGSSIMTSLSWADGLAVIPPDSLVSKGEMLEYYPFESFL